MVEAYGQEIIELPVAPCITEEIIYVAVGDIVKESILTIAWALQKSKGKKICLLHVLQPSQKIPLCESEVRPHINLAIYKFLYFHEYVCLQFEICWECVKWCCS